MFLIVKRYTQYINNLLNHISNIAVRYGEVRTNLDSGNYLCNKKAIRFICEINYHDYTSLFFHTSKMLKRHDLATDKTMIIFYSANIHFINSRVQAFFKPTAGINIYGTRQNCFYAKQINNAISLFSLAVKGVETWNSLTN